MRFAWAGLAYFVVALAGCGGGGGGGSSSPPGIVPTNPPATPSPAPSSTGGPAPAVGYLGGAAPVFSGTTSSTASVVTVSPVSQTFSVLPPLPVFAPASVRLDVGAATQSAFRRTVDIMANPLPPSPPRVSLSAERLVDLASLRSSLTTGLRRSPSSVVAAATSASPPATDTFAILAGGIGTSATSYTQVATTLQQTSAHGYVYVDNSLGLPSNVVAAVASDFENAYLSDSTHFGTSDYPNNAPHGPLNGTGTPCDGSGNPIPGATPIPVVIPDTDGHTYVVVVSQANAGNGEGGYFDPANYFVQAWANCSHKISNGVPMIVLVWPSGANANYEIQEDMVRVTAHEFQHLINFVNHCILAPQCLIEDDPWLNEGLSMLAQDFAVHQLYPSLTYDVDDALYYAGQFLQRPQSFNIAAFDGIDAGSSSPSFNCNGCYGGAYLFQRYLYNRFGGDLYTHAMETGSGTSSTNLAAVTGASSPGALVGDLSIALMAAQNGLSATAPFTFAPAPGTTFVDQLGAATTLAPLGSAGTNAPGTSIIYNSCQGCFFYVSVPTNKISVTLKVTDVSPTSASLAAGVVQR